MTRISISDTFDGGNIELIGTEGENGSCCVMVRIKPDVYTELEKTSHSQYFCFRSTVGGLENGKSTLATYIIENAAAVSYPVAWNGSTVFFTKNMADFNSWRRKLDTTYQDGKLIWTHKHERNGSVFFSYFPPYTYLQHLDLVSRCADSPIADVQSLGQTLEGRELECVRVGQGKTVGWIIHRQHPGETMAEYYAEGLLARLLGLESGGEVDRLVRKVLQHYTLYIVPCMCLDGAVKGYLRTNSVGANLNREWANVGDYQAPTLERSPEVYHVWKKMEETGVDCFVDVHGDEELPFNFLSGAEATQNWGERLQGLHGAFVAAYERANSDMQKGVGYAPPPPGVGTRLNNVATRAVANRFNCLAVTLEMPFKDCATNPDPERGWSPHRSRKLGGSVLDALAYIEPYLRAEGAFWNDLGPEDAYVRPTHKYHLDN